MKTTKQHIMKKKLLFNVFAFIILSATATGQTLQFITEDEGVLEDGQVITVTGSPDEGLISAYIDVKNTGSEALDLKVRRQVHETVEGSVNMFCWGVCYAASVDTALQSITLGSGEVSSDFYGDYVPGGAVGVTKISYFVYDINNTENEVEVEVHYNTQTIHNSTLTLVTEEEGELTHEQVITVNGSLDESVVYAYIDVRNDDELPIDVRVRRVENNLVEGSDNVFCWGVCYSNTIDTSSMAINIEPGAVSQEFSGDYSPEGHEGTTSISYYFYDERNPDNEIGVEVHYKVESTSIRETAFESGIKSYPVPADDMLNVEFKLKAHHDATLTVHNMLGKVVMRKPVSPDGMMHLNTSKLQDGIYFYTIQNQNRVAATRKFVVSH
jgi:hypothetical protein